MYKILMMLILISNTSWAGEFRFLDLDYLGMEYRKHYNYRDAYFPEYETIEGQCNKSKECFTYGANVLFDLTLIQLPVKLGTTPLSLFWRNDVHMDSTTKQVRHVGWKWELGLPIGDRIEIFHRHHSRHVMEAENKLHGFPLRDEYVLKMHFYKGDK